MGSRLKGNEIYKRSRQIFSRETGSVTVDRFNSFVCINFVFPFLNEIYRGNV